MIKSCPQTNDEVLEKLRKRARSKYISRSVSSNLTNTVSKSPLHKAYKRSLWCAHRVSRKGEKLISSYCRGRWCPVCNRIRTGKFINGYVPQIERLPDLHFVTLTARTVTLKGLPDRLKQMQANWKKIYHLAKVTKRTDYAGLRSLECTARPKGKYHPHFHILIAGKENAEWLVKHWLRLFGNLTSRKAQDIRKADLRSLKEMFKYATKLTMFEKNEKVKVPAKRLDEIFVALHGKRTYQTFGGLKAVADDLEHSLYSQKAPEGLVGDVWEWVQKDWVDWEKGEHLSGFVPSAEDKRLFSDGEVEK